MRLSRLAATAVSLLVSGSALGQSKSPLDSDDINVLKGELNIIKHQRDSENDYIVSLLRQLDEAQAKINSLEKPSK